MTRVPSILSTRIELVSLSPAFLDNLLGGRNFIAEGMGGFPLPMRSFPKKIMKPCCWLNVTSVFPLARWSRLLSFPKTNS